MTPRRLYAAGATLSITALLITAAPATAGPAPAPAGRPDGSTVTVPVAEPQVPPELIAAMQRDLGLTRAEAVNRLGNEARARVLQPALEDRLDGAYAGAWVDRDGTLVVATTDATGAATVTAAGARVKVVGRSLTALTSIKDTFDAVAKRAPDQDVPVWFVDEPTNTVVVQALDAAAGAGFVAASGVDPAAVRIETITERPAPYHDLRGGDAYFINDLGRCSIGFSITRGTTPGFVTAGHCGTAGRTTNGFNGVAQGTVQAASFPGNDFGWVAVNSNWTPTPVVYGYGNGDVRVTGSAEAPAGSAVCRSGSTTGWRCGTIQQRNTSVTYREGTVNQVVRTNACAEPGDSGGSFISGTHAQGVTSGGSGNCTVGGTIFFQPVNEILQTYGLTLVTAAPSACAGHPNQATANLPVRQGSFGIQYIDPGYHPSSAGFTTTTTGTHTGCLDGASTSAMRLSLERQTCCGSFGIPTWTQVGIAGAGSTVKTLSLSLAPGTYRWVVSVAQTLYQGQPTGPYFLGFTRPS
jgi:streptogrisin C